MSFDDGRPVVVDALEHNTNRDWEETVKDSVRTVHCALPVASPGYHTLNIWMVDPGVAVQKIIVDMGGLRPSYLGPAESFHGIVKKRNSPDGTDKRTSGN